MVHDDDRLASGFSRVLQEILKVEHGQARVVAQNGQQKRGGKPIFSNDADVEKMSSTLSIHGDTSTGLEGENQ